jgi:glutamyl-tRNA(Gln) amidotransferase subunit E
MAYVRANLPELPEQIESRLISEYSINQQQARQIVRRDNTDLFERICKEYDMASIAASMFLNTYGELEHEGIDLHVFADEGILEVFGMLKRSRFAKEALPLLLKEIATGSSAEQAITKLGLESVGSDEAVEIIAKIIKEREDFVRSKGLDAIGPLMGPVMGALRGKIDGKKANDLLAQEIKKLIG